ncbi:MAG: hypothetical protein LH631_05750 [Alkalinema sp. CAN_BIN05]|nr:hypothetical protein [Alkalinema sp. CAN_BIN05]
MKLIQSLAPRSSAAFALALGVATTGLLPLATLRADAQVRPGQYNVSRPAVFNPSIRIISGAVIPANYLKAPKIVLALDEKMTATLNIPRNIRRSGDDRLLIPSGSTVEGEFRPASITRDGKEEKGTRFYARTLVLPNGSSMMLDATSDLITRKETISKGINTSSILTGAAVGAGAGAIVSAVTGNRQIGWGNILIGTAAGAVGGWLANGQNKADVLVVNTETDLGLRLASPLTLNSAY